MSAAPTQPAFVFLISHGRAGSTLVQEVLARHHDVGFISNIEDRMPRLPAGAGRYNNQLYRRVPQRFTRKGRLRYAPSEGWRLLRRQVSPMLAASSRDLVAADATPWVAQRFRTFFEERAAAQGKPVFLHKLTGWPRAGFIRAVFPDARFIHVVRDGRAVADSDLRVSWWRGYLGPESAGCGALPPEYAAEWEESGHSYAVLAAEVWKVSMDAYAAARAQVPVDHWLDVRFEQLVLDPRSSFKEMIGFMGLDVDARFEAALARTQFSPDRCDAFRAHLDAPTLARLDGVLADHLACWGYAA